MVIATITAARIKTKPRKAASHAIPKRKRGSIVAIGSIDVRRLFMPHLA